MTHPHRRTDRNGFSSFRLWKTIRKASSRFIRMPATDETFWASRCPTPTHDGKVMTGQHKRASASQSVLENVGLAQALHSVELGFTCGILGGHLSLRLLIRCIRANTIRLVARVCGRSPEITQCRTTHFTMSMHLAESAHCCSVVAVLNKFADQ